MSPIHAPFLVCFTAAGAAPPHSPPLSISGLIYLSICLSAGVVALLPLPTRLLLLLLLRFRCLLVFVT